MPEWVTIVIAIAAGLSASFLKPLLELMKARMTGEAKVTGVRNEVLEQRIEELTIEVQKLKQLVKEKDEKIIQMLEERLVENKEFGEAKGALEAVSKYLNRKIHDNEPE